MTERDIQNIVSELESKLYALRDTMRKDAGRNLDVTWARLAYVRSILQALIGLGLKSAQPVADAVQQRADAVRRLSK